MSPSTCPCHAGEFRDERFAELDALIAAGYGSVPMSAIEAIRQQHGGKLPPRQAEDDPDDFSVWLARARANKVPQVEMVFAAVDFGYDTTRAVADVLGFDVRTVAAYLHTLRRRRRVEECGLAVVCGIREIAVRQYRTVTK